MYDFDRFTERRNTNSMKWNVAENELPMWVADMDFETAQEIREAIQNRAALGIYGYTIVPEAWYAAYREWWDKRHHFLIDREWLLFCTGVVPAVSSIIRKLTTPGEKILVQTPVYNIFFHSIENNGRIVSENQLCYEQGEYKLDLEDLERKLADPQTTLMILCNPHNPTGKIWSRSELEQIGQLCSQYYVTVISDEIHCDLTAPGLSYIPFASVSDICRKISITCIAPTKAFNLAGLQTAAVVVPDAQLRHKVWRALNTDEIAEPNVFAIDGAIAAFTRGEAWLEELREYLFINRREAEHYIQIEIPEIKVLPSPATYLLWLDCSDYNTDSAAIAAYLQKETGLYLSEGGQFRGNGTRFLRMNIACPRLRLEDGLKRMKKGLKKRITK